MIRVEPTIVIIIPVMNEVGTVASVVRAARAHAPVVVVDDGSTDGSGDAARAAGGEVIRHRRRLGKAQALRTGIAAARARGAALIVTLDGDGQHRPEDLPILLDAARESPRSVIIGSRLGSAVTLPPGRLAAIQVAGFFVSWASGLTVRDTQSGYRVYPLVLFTDIRPRRGGFVFETEILIEAATRGWAIREVAVTAVPEATRPSRFRLRDGVAISAYLAGQTLARWRVELGEAAQEFRLVFSGSRRRARHAAMLQAAVPYADSLGLYASAVGTAAVQRMSRRLSRWWHDPRRRRAGAAAVAIAWTPGLLALAIAQTVAGSRRADLIGWLVERVYRQERLQPSGERATAARAPQPAIAEP